MLFRLVNPIFKLEVQIAMVLSSRGTGSLNFLINPCGNDIWTYNLLYYLYDLCTCSDLDQIEF